MRSPQAGNRLSMADYFCLSMLLFSLSMGSMTCNCLRWPSQAYIFSFVTHSRLFTANLFCLVFGKKFNIMSALIVHQSLTLPQKIDSRGGLFWCKKGSASACGKMNFYLNKLPFATVSVSFGANWSAFWCWIECDMVLNARCFGAKRSAFWC